MKVTIISSKNLSDVTTWVLNNVNTLESRVYFEYGNMYINDVREDFKSKLHSTSKDIVIHTYHQNVISKIAEVCENFGIGYSYYRIYAEGIGEVRYYNDILGIIKEG